MNRTPMESWIAQRITGKSGAITMESIRTYQLEKIRNSISFAQRHSSFYKTQLSDMAPESIQTFDDFSITPFTTMDDLLGDGSKFLATPQGIVERIVTLQAPSGGCRRIFLTAEDLESTIDFFHHGMSTLVKPGKKVMIFMPGDRPTSVGHLLSRALERLNVKSHIHGLIVDPSAAIDDLLTHEPNCLVAVPIQALEMVRSQEVDLIPSNAISGVLLSGDYVSEVITKEISGKLSCPVFTHYGTAEMGFGGGVECEALEGYHLREADLYIEIVDPATGEALPANRTGEVVFTTLKRTAMPLIRYRTGDMASLTYEKCPCGASIRRLNKIKGRLGDLIRLKTGAWIGIEDLDEALFQIGSLLNFAAYCEYGIEKDLLAIEALTDHEKNRGFLDIVLESALGIGAIHEAHALGILDIVVSFSKNIERPGTTAFKRRIQQVNP